MCKIGSAGKIYLMPKIDKPASLGRNAFLIRFNEQTINMTYLFAYLNTHDLQKDIQQRVKRAVTKTITKDEVRSIPLILPPKSLQDEYSSFVEQIDKLKFNCFSNFLFSLSNLMVKHSFLRSSIALTGFELCLIQLKVLLLNYPKAV